jgi:uncharacterized protein YegP (UPF0339 family)
MACSFVLKRAADGQYFFNLKAANGEVILTSETYKEKHSAEEGIQSVIRNSAFDERYVRKTSADGKPYFVLTAANKEIIGKSETYSSKEALENGVASVKRNAPVASVVDET